MKNNKKPSIWQLITLFSLLVITSVAQPGGGPPPSAEKKEEIEAMKIAFLTRKLDLTPDEAKTFWPVYNQFQDELDKLRDSHRKQKRDVRDGLDTMSDKELEKVVDGEIAFRQSELDLLKKYNDQFKNVLPLKKVAQLYRAEDDFKRELLQRIQERPKGGPPKHPKDAR